MKPPALRSTIMKEFVSFPAVITIFLVTCLYIIITALLLNYRLVWDTLTGGFPFSSQITILVALIEGIWITMHIWDSILFAVNALLVGVNMYLILRTIYLLEHLGKVKLSIGGAAIISFITTGCASCGLSLLSVLGISVSFSFFPFHGMELHILATVILLFSAAYMTKKIHDAKYCRL